MAVPFWIDAISEVKFQLLTILQSERHGRRANFATSLAWLRQTCRIGIERWGHFAGGTAT